MEVDYGIAIKSTLRKLLESGNYDLLFNILAIPGTLFEGERSAEVNKSFNINHIIDRMIDPNLLTSINRENLHNFNKTFKQYCIVHLIKAIQNYDEKLLDKSIICGFYLIKSTWSNEGIVAMALPDGSIEPDVSIEAWRTVCNEALAVGINEADYTVSYVLIDALGR